MMYKKIIMIYLYKIQKIKILIIILILLIIKFLSNWIVKNLLNYFSYNYIELAYR